MIKKNVNEYENDKDDEYDENDEESNEIVKTKRIFSHYDDTVEVLGADDVQSPPGSAGISLQNRLVKGNNTLSEMKTEKDKILKSVNKFQWKKDDAMGQLADNTDNSDQDDNEGDDDDDDDDDEDDGDIRAPIIQDGYDPSEYEQLGVSEEIKDIFSYITKYTPQNIELENKLCPFLPEFIPAVGDIDAFVKVPRPDGVKDSLGLTVLDEPSLQQSDPEVLQLQLRAVDKLLSTKAVVVKKIDNAEKNGKSIVKWIKAVSDLHSTKPATTVQYTRPMPNIDNLMQEWPLELEEKLMATGIPSADLDCDLSTYVTIICNLFDIPVYESKIQSLHTFFYLYSVMKSSQEQLQQQSNEKVNNGQDTV